MKNNSILIVEDEALVAEDLKACISEMGYKVSAMIAHGEDVLTLLQGSRPDLVLMDIVLAGDIDGIDVAQKIKEQYNIPVIYLTAYTDKEKLERAQATEAYGYLVKPFDERELRTTIGMALFKADADRRLRESRNWSQAVLTSIADAVITIDNDNSIRYINAAAEQITGWSNIAATKRDLHEVLKLSDEQPLKLTTLITSLADESADSAHKNTLSAQLQPQQGTAIDVDISIGAIKHDHGERDGIVIAFRDVTLQRQARDILEQTNRELERRVLDRTRELQQTNRKLDAARLRSDAASEAKSRFLANMSHELRTPLNIIMGYADLWKTNQHLSAGHIEQANDVYAAGHNLLSMINDILEIAQSDTGDIQLTSGPIDLVRLVHHAAAAYKPHAQKKKGLQFTCSIPDKLPPVVMGDAARIQTVLNRLLDNAIRFTRAGNVELMLEYSENANAEILTRFNVIDTGIGVTDKSRIFESLSQQDDGLDRGMNGAGLGLTISRRLVELMGGRIDVDDNPGGGSRFWFELNLPVADD